AQGGVGRKVVKVVENPVVDADEENGGKNAAAHQSGRSQCGDLSFGHPGLQGLADFDYSFGRVVPKPAVLRNLGFRQLATERSKLRVNQAKLGVGNIRPNSPAASDFAKDLKLTVRSGL